MTEENLKLGQHLLTKIRFAKQRIKECMQSESFNKNNPVKQEYFSGKVNEWTLKLDNLRKEFKEL